MKNPHDITKDLEQAICDYTGAPYCVVVNSCTNALLLAVSYYRENLSPIPPADRESWDWLEIPKHTYVGVAQSILNAGYRNVAFRDEYWIGSYRLDPSNIYDCARMFTSGMYVPGTVQCCSFHTTKIFGDTQGGCILHDSIQADEYYRRARFDGRTENVPPSEDTFIRGHHCYISPDVSARLLWKMFSLPKHNDPLPNDDYPDLSQQEIFK